MRHTLEHLYRVYNDDHGHYIEIGPDGDGIDLIEIRSCNKDGKIESSGNARVTMPYEQAVLVAQALNKYLAQFADELPVK